MVWGQTNFLDLSLSAMWMICFGEVIFEYLVWLKTSKLTNSDYKFMYWLKAPNDQWESI